MSILDKLRDELAKLAAGEQPNMMHVAPYMSNTPREPPPATPDAIRIAMAVLNAETFVPEALYSFSLEQFGSVSPGDLVGLDSVNRMVLYDESNKASTQLLGFFEGLDSDGNALIRTGGARPDTSVRPGDKVSFDVTQESFLPWPAPPPPPPEPPWVSSDADGRTRTAEWQESVRQRFERRVGAALVAGR